MTMIIEQAAHITLAENAENLELSRHYISTAKKISEKLVLKMYAV